MARASTDWPRDKLRVAVVEEHDKALHHIYKGIARKRIPFSGLEMIHFDSHPDLTVPEVDAETVFNRRLLFDSLSIENWIIPAVLAGHVHHVVWLHPEWAEQMADGRYSLTVGVEPDNSQLRVDCPLVYFLEDGVFLPRDLMSPTPRADATLTVSDFTYRPEEDEKGRPWLLDIDLDTFSTADPFREAFTPEMTRLADELYSARRQCLRDDASLRQMTPQQLLSMSRARKARLDVLKALSEEIAESEGDSAPPHPEAESGSSSTALPHGESREESQQAQVDADSGSSCSPPDPDMEAEKSRLRPVFLSLLNAARDWLDVAVGNSHAPARYLHYLLTGWSPGSLPHHVATEEEICTRITDQLEPQLRSFLRDKGPPALVTLSRSSSDDYCPSHQVDFIQSRVLACLRSVFEPVLPLDVHLDY